METKISNVINKIKTNKVYSTVSGILFPIVLTALCFVNVNKGIDITDSAYSCSNFVSLDRLDGMWFVSTFYANLLGKLITVLPGGMTLLGMNIWTSVVKVFILLGAYFFFSFKTNVGKEKAFIGEFVAGCLFWCPSTILYNNLTYLLFFAGAACLWSGIKEDRPWRFVLAGFLLGSNIFVRFPNVCEAALILVVWYDAFLKRAKAAEWLKKTGLCMAGYFGSFIPAFILASVTVGVKAYFTGISELFVMTGDATDYSAFGMIINLAKSYVHAWTWLEPTILFLLLVLLGCLVFPSKLNAVRYAVSAAIAVFLLGFLYKKALFSFDYHSYGAVYGIGKLVLCLAVIMFLLVLAVPKESRENKMLSLASLVIIAVTPLGSNNEVYANLNNLFWVIPVFLMILLRFTNVNEYFRGVRLAVFILFAGFAFQSILFGFTFRFRDGMQAPMDTKVAGNAVLNGMYTTQNNAKDLEELTALWNENNLSEGEVLLFGDVSGLAFYMGTPVAISTAWPSLDSFSTDKYTSQMVGLEKKIENKECEKPAVIVGAENTEQSKTYYAKKEILNEFLEKYHYKPLYSNERFSLLIAE